MALSSGTSCTPDAACSSSDIPVSQNVAVGVGPPNLVPMDDARATEGETITFQVRLNYTATGPVTVDCATEDDTATAGEDYISRSGMLRFATGERYTTVTVPTLDDNDGNRETFKLRLSNVTGAFIASDTATRTIRS